MMRRRSIEYEIKLENFVKIILAVPEISVKANVFALPFAAKDVLAELHGGEKLNESSLAT